MLRPSRLQASLPSQPRSNTFDPLTSSAWQPPSANRHVGRERWQEQGPSSPGLPPSCVFLGHLLPDPAPEEPTPWPPGESHHHSPTEGNTVLHPAPRRHRRPRPAALTAQDPRRLPECALQEPSQTRRSATATQATLPRLLSPSAPLRAVATPPGVQGAWGNCLFVWLGPHSPRPAP